MTSVRGRCLPPTLNTEPFRETIQDRLKKMSFRQRGTGWIAPPLRNYPKTHSIMDEREVS